MFHQDCKQKQIFDKIARQDCLPVLWIISCVGPKTCSCVSYAERLHRLCTLVRVEGLL